MKAVVLNGTKTHTQTNALETSEKKRIGILGGTFNPPHLGHLIMAEQVGKQLGLSKVLFMPTNEPPHKKNKQVVSPEHRKNMIERAIQDNALFEFEGMELEREGKSYTYDTMKELKKKYPKEELYFIIGGDMATTLKEWHRIDELVDMVQFVAVKRPEFGMATDFPVLWVDSPEVAISSTIIRNKIKSGCTVKYLIPQPTLDYIKKEELYK